MKFEHSAKLFIIGIFICLSQNIHAQTNIVITDSITVINNTKFFVHHVQKKETLYSISKAYKTTVEDIISNNPNAKDGLSIGEYLLVPFSEQISIESPKYIKHKVEQNETISSIAKLYNVSPDSILKYNPEVRKNISVNQLLLFPKTTEIIAYDPDFLYHQIKPKETLFGLSQRYGVKIKIITKNNPQIEERGLQIGELIKIPKNKVDLNDKIMGQSNSDYIFHKVERKQTLYSISKLYNVDISAIIQENPELEKRGLISGEILKIATKKKITEDADIVKINDTIHIDSLLPPEITEFDCMERNINSERPINVALMLPLYTSVNEAINREDSDEESNNTTKEKDATYKIYSRSKIFIDFYQGCLVALNDLKEKGYSVNLYVFDTENDTNKVKEIIFTNKLQNIDLIIGPVFSENIQIVSEYAKNEEKIIVSPLSVFNDFLNDNLFAFQVSPNFDKLSNYANHYLNNLPSKNFIIIHDQDNFKNDFINPFKNTFFNSLNNKLDYSPYYYQEIGFYSAQDSLFDYALIKGKENIVIIPSSSQAFVSTVISKLNAYTTDYEIKVFGMPRWRKFENIEPEVLHNLEVQLFSNYYLDIEKENIKNFIRDFREFFKEEPIIYSYQAYDIFKYFIESYNTFGNTIPYCINKMNKDLLVSDFYFSTLKGQKGQSNISIYLLFYNHEYDIKLLKTYYE